MENVFYLIILCSFSVCAMQKDNYLDHQIMQNLNSSLPELLKTKRILDIDKFTLDQFSSGEEWSWSGQCHLKFCNNLPYALTTRRGKFIIHVGINQMLDAFQRGKYDLDYDTCSKQIPKNLRKILVKNLEKEFSVEKGRSGIQDIYFISPKKDD